MLSATFRAMPRATAPAARLFSTSAPQRFARMHLIGRLGDAPEIVPTSTGREIVKYSLAVPTGPRNEDGSRGTSWFRVTSFADGNQRDALLRLPKGSKIFVEADARQEGYEAADGEKKFALNLIQRSFETLTQPRPPPTEHDGLAAAEAH